MKIRPRLGVLAVEQHGHPLDHAKRTRTPKFFGCRLVAVVDNGLCLRTIDVTHRGYHEAWRRLQSGELVSLELYTLDEALVERCTIEENTVLSRRLAKAS